MRTDYSCYNQKKTNERIQEENLSSSKIRRLLKIRIKNSL